MNSADDDFLGRLRATFHQEAAEHLQAIATALLAVENAPTAEEQRHIVDTAFRAAHSLKGAARAVDYTNVEAGCQELEDTFAVCKRQRAAPSPGMLEMLHRTLDAVSAAVQSHAQRPQPLMQPSRAQRAEAARPESAPAPVPGAESTAGGEETVRIPVERLDARVLEAEEMLVPKLAARHRAAALRDLAARFQLWRKEYAAIEPTTRRLRKSNQSSSLSTALRSVVPLLDFVEWTHEYLDSLEEAVAGLHAMAVSDSRTLTKLVDDLLENSKKLLLLPFGTVTAPFRKLVRDLSRDLGREVNLEIHGEEINIDKRVLEEIKDPLVHLLRNAVDHGIEAPEERERAGKPRRGTIVIAASQVDGNKVQITVSDDGAGIDLDGVRAAAVECGLLSKAHARALPDADVPALIFESEVSTRADVTRLSGRGLGLAIVRERAEKLGGAAAVESARGSGARFSLVLPSTLATFRGVLVQEADRQFVIPTHAIDRVARIPLDDIRPVEGRETVVLDGCTMALIRLAHALELPPAEVQRTSSYAIVVVLGTGDHRVAFAIDAVVDEQDVLVKPLRPPLARVRNVSGATILDSGTVVPILRAADLLKAAKRSAGPNRLPKPSEASPATEPRSVLVAEDSITSRTLLKSILESAGYRVKTAVDGRDALNLLASERFDLLVSDVEMPHLDGFNLAARIRADRRLSELPIVLVTALDRPEDRIRGIDVGADAYIVKSSFDRSDLLDTVRRLIS